ncbi:uncharacterized protein LOC122809734 isoform X2 [Protopterus annectens]|uniref:uncharacterized protein LOC122809734 isoform X2 n=1 Tax=Protopterus annectens TaxID=7888 RepID=UPI001CFA84AF|nr:uncharacterized protein LOC122809734 isoform X2 [Protopterus annectens]
MAFQKSCFGQPWIADLVTKYKKADKQLKSVPALVLAFVNLTEKQAEDPCSPAAALHISDTQYCIKAFVSEKAKLEMEQEEEHYVLSDIKHKVIILRNYSIEFRAEEELKDCEFYVLIQQFRILPMESNIITTPFCNKDYAVQKKIEELWKSHVAVIDLKAMSCSDVSLTQLLNVVEEENMTVLRSVAEACLDIRRTAKPSPSKDKCTLQPWWQTSQKQQKEGGSIFTVPVSWLIIPPDQKEALENTKDWKNDAVCSTLGTCETMLEDEEGNGNMSCVEEMKTYPSFVCSETAVDENKDFPAVNPWNTFQSVSFSTSLSSGEVPVLCQSSHELQDISDARDKEEEMPQPDSSTPDDLCFPSQDPEGDHLQNSSVAVEEEGEMNVAVSPSLFPDSSVNLSSSFCGTPNSEPEKSVVHVDETPLLSCEDRPCSIVKTVGISESTVLKNYSVNPFSSSLGDSRQHASTSNCQSPSVLRNPSCKPVVTDRSAQESHETCEFNICTSESDILESEEEQRHRVYLCTIRKPQVSKRKRRSCSESCDDSFKSGEELGILMERGGRISVGETKYFLRSRCDTEKSPTNMNQALCFKEVNEIQRNREQQHLNAVTQVSPEPKRHQGKVSLERPVHTLNSERVQRKVNSNGDEGPSRPASQVHSDGTTFQYQYGTPSSDLCKTIQSIRIPKRLLNWALQVIPEHGSNEDT